MLTRGIAPRFAAAAAALFLLHTAPTSITEADAAPAHSRLVFAAGEEVSTLHGFTSGQVPDPNTYWTVPRDFSAYTPEVWRLLQNRGAAIAVNMRWQRDFGPVPAGMPRFDELLPFLRTAADHHVGVVAWLTIPYSDGYWATEDNVAQHERMIRDFDAWTHAVEFRPEEVVLDLEAPLTDTAVFNKAFRDPLPAVQMLARNIGPEQQCEAMHGYERVVAWLEEHGYPTKAAAYSYLFDDIADGDLGLSDALDMPVPRPGVFRELGFMAMRSVYASMIGSDPGPSIHSAYIAEMKRWYGDSATFSLGEAGEGPYEHDLGELVRDTRLAAALTTGTVGIYSLDKALADYGIAGVSELFDAAERPLTGAELAAATEISPTAKAARGLVGVENAAVGTLAPIATGSQGSVRSPNPWPPTC
ncbi:hypothetical protein [Nocardia bovistercoris]|uniref:Glycoside hydrolase family 42 N-terminal domain-containing protein n=1 Tax=Nocardia bovistercoris TaxID=2785916 RepID=A0A931ICQ7_9NOCA|nr:hypothetical protein [Nocardia bovistercoris]MBH0779247.1 hypothetical protein [Nocardia bovistercoris]